jgi:5-methylcytosine-specific restriction endonuclease McrA
MLLCGACDAKHFLFARFSTSSVDVIYCRYTFRHPLDCYDESELPFDIRQYLSHTPPESEESDVFAGPIKIYPRKKRFTTSDLLTIWRATNGMCHLCRDRRWKLNERGKNGWHVDHIIPHIGGGAGLQKLANLRVACAKCNLSKGRGYTVARVRIAVRNLIEQVYAPTTDSGQKKPPPPQLARSNLKRTPHRK